ncbi:MAG TPA: DUF1800 family protein, partial [Pseudonocardiaceae bacterium]
MAERDVVRRLLERVGLGPRPGELERALAAGPGATLDGLLTAAPDGPAAPAVRSYDREDREALRAGLAALRRWWLGRMVATAAPFPERLTFFWHGHFATSARTVRDARLMLVQHETLRALGGGPFRPLVAALAVDPAMLVWLDGGRNRRGRPNENLARELMELFTLGVGHYSERDVREAARALTGWEVDRAAGTATLRARRHDDGVKTVLGVSGRLGVDELVDLLVARPECPRFLAGRFWLRFVSDTPPPPGRLDELAARATTTTELLRAVVTAPEFGDPASVLVRQPVEWLVAALRALGATAPPDGADRGLAGLGQVL